MALLHFRISKWCWMMKKCLCTLWCAYSAFLWNHNTTKWLMGFLWPWTCPPNKSNQLLVESPWRFVPNVRKLPGGVFELLCSREWNRHMDDRTRRKRCASSNDDRWHNKRQHPDCVHHCKKKEKRSQISPFLHFLIFIFADTVTHSSTEFSISRRVKQVNRCRKHCKPDRSWNYEEKQ